MYDHVSNQGKHVSVFGLTVAALLAFTLGLSACGDSDDGGDAKAGQADSAQSGDQQEVEATFKRIQQGFVDGDPQAVCDQLSPKGLEETADDGGTEYPTCRKRAAAMIRDYGKNLRANTSVIKVRVDGNRAIATIKAGEVTTYLARFVKTPDGWKFDQSLAPKA